MARPRKPYVVKKLEGNRGKRRLDPPAIEESCQLPKPPKWIGKFGREEWDRIAASLHEMKLLTETNSTMFAMYCSAVDKLRRALDLIEAEGETFETDKGYMGPHPAVSQANKAMEIALRYGTEFGLTPISRERIKGSGKDQAVQESLIDGEWKPAGSRPAATGMPIQ